MCHHSFYLLSHGKSQSDYWDENWQEALKRKVIKESRDLHRLKGTPAAIKKALEPFGYEVTLIEWFKAEPNLVPGTFNLELNVIGKSLNAETYSEINRLVLNAKSSIKTFNQSDGYN